MKPYEIPKELAEILEQVTLAADAGVQILHPALQERINRFCEEGPASIDQWAFEILELEKRAELADEQAKIITARRNRLVDRSRKMRDILADVVDRCFEGKVLTPSQRTIHVRDGYLVIR
jgi:hypothetical protein